MAVNTYAGQPQPIKFALTTGRRKIPISALNINRATLQIFDRDTLVRLAILDSAIDADTFYWNRTVRTVKGVPFVYLLEMELHNSGLPVQEDLIARLTIYDGANPLGISWKQFSLNSR